MLRRVKGAAAGKDCHALEERLLRRSEQIVTPGNRITHRLLPRREVAGASGQQRQALLQAPQQRLWWEQFDKGRGELNRQRKAIEPMANLRHRGGVVHSHGEAGLHRSRPLDKEANRLELEHVLERRQVLRIRHQERRKRVLLLTSGVEWRAARHQYLRTWSPGEETGDERRRLEHAFEIIQDQ